MILKASLPFIKNMKIDGTLDTQKEYCIDKCMNTFKMYFLDICCLVRSTILSLSLSHSLALFLPADDQIRWSVSNILGMWLTTEVCLWPWNSLLFRSNDTKKTRCYGLSKCLPEIHIKRLTLGLSHFKRWDLPGGLHTGAVEPHPDTFSHVFTSQQWCKLVVTIVPVFHDFMTHYSTAYRLELVTKVYVLSFKLIISGICYSSRKLT